MTRYLRLLRLFFRTELQYELEYRLNFVIEIVETVVVTATSVGAVLILFSYTTVLNGWDLGAMLVLLGCFYLVQGFGEFALQPSFEKFLENVRLGTLDFALLKPASAQFLVTLRNFRVVQLAQMAGKGPTRGKWRTAPPGPANPPPPVRIVGLRTRAQFEARAQRQWSTLLQGTRSREGELLVYRWPESPLRIAVELDAAVGS